MGWMRSEGDSPETIAGKVNVDPPQVLRILADVDAGPGVRVRVMHPSRVGNPFSRWAVGFRIFARYLDEAGSLVERVEREMRGGVAGVAAAVPAPGPQPGPRPGPSHN